jgi:hypothetical protein
LWGWLLAKEDIKFGKHVKQKRNHPQILGIDAAIQPEFEVYGPGFTLP